MLEWTVANTVVEYSKDRVRSILLKNLCVMLPRELPAVLLEIRPHTS